MHSLVWTEPGCVCAKSITRGADAHCPSSLRSFFVHMRNVRVSLRVTKPVKRTCTNQDCPEYWSTTLRAAFLCGEDSDCSHDVVAVNDVASPSRFVERSKLGASKCQ